MSSFFFFETHPKRVFFQRKKFWVASSCWNCASSLLHTQCAMNFNSEHIGTALLNRALLQPPRAVFYSLWEVTGWKRRHLCAINPKVFGFFHSSFGIFFSSAFSSIACARHSFIERWRESCPTLSAARTTIPGRPIAECYYGHGNIPPMLCFLGSLYGRRWCELHCSPKQWCCFAITSLQHSQRIPYNVRSLQSTRMPKRMAKNISTLY